MAELITGEPGTATSNCCATETQQTCCEPSEKSACCGASPTGGTCGCRDERVIDPPHRPEGASPWPS